MDAQNQDQSSSLLPIPREEWAAPLHAARKKFLQLALVTGVAARSAGQFSYVRLRHWYYRPTHATSSGALSTHALETLLALVDAFLGLPFERARYADFFAWRARKLAGHRALYEQLAGALDRMATAAGARDFLGADPAIRRRIVARCTRGTKRRWMRWLIAIADRDARRVQSYVLDPVAELYAQTDAWIALGYDAWPGMSRGLEAYRRPNRAPAAASRSWTDAT
jgi:hypothetical protein